MTRSSPLVIPAKAGIQDAAHPQFHGFTCGGVETWTPAFAGVTVL